MTPSQLPVRTMPTGNSASDLPRSSLRRHLEKNSRLWTKRPALFLWIWSWTQCSLIEIASLSQPDSLSDTETRGMRNKEMEIKYSRHKRQVDKSEQYIEFCSSYAYCMLLRVNDHFIHSAHCENLDSLGKKIAISKFEHFGAKRRLTHHKQTWLGNSWAVWEKRRRIAISPLIRKEKDEIFGIPCLQIDEKEEGNKINVTRNKQTISIISYLFLSVRHFDLIFARRSLSRREGSRGGRKVMKLNSVNILFRGGTARSRVLNFPPAASTRST